MRLDGLLDIYQKNPAIDPFVEGLKNYTLTLTKPATPAGIQPKSLTPVELSAFGVSDINENARICFINSDPEIIELMHAQDLLTLKWYEIKATNPWPSHTELLLTPIQGGEQ